MTPDPITTAREAVLELRQIACLLNDDQAQTGANFDRETAITAALDYAERLTRDVRDLQDLAKIRNEQHAAELEKLKAERDEALCRLLSAGSEKPTAEDMDWAISLSASLRREEITVEDNEITRLTSQLELYKAALEGISEVDDDGFTSDGHERCAERAAMVLRQAASQWTKDRQATLSKGITE